MLDLKCWLQDQGLTVRELAVELEVPLKTARDWAYRGVAPSAVNQASLTGYIMLHCAPLVDSGALWSHERRRLSALR